MNVFHTFFGLSPSQIKQNVVLLPSNDLSAFSEVKILSKDKGRYFAVATTQLASFVTTSFNLLIGDAVLLLKETDCRSLILFGPCGGLGNLKIGDLAVLSAAFNLESFTQMLRGETPQPAYPDKDLSEALYSFLKADKVKSAKGATVGSLLLEESYLAPMKELGVECVDMEASLVFSAASSSKIRAAALFYVTDLAGGSHLEYELTTEDKTRIFAARKTLAKRTLDFLYGRA